MSMTIIIVLVLALVGLVVVRAKQGKQDAEPKKNKPSQKNNKATKTPAAQTTSVKTPEKPSKAAKANTAAKQENIKDSLNKIDILINNKDYAKAEGLSHLTLNQNPDAHEVYFKLLNIYQLQNDDFAIKKLLDLTLKLNLNEVYQQLYTQNEVYQHGLSQQDTVQDIVPSVSHTSNQVKTPVSNVQSEAPEEILLQSVISPAPNDALIKKEIEPKTQQTDTLDFNYNTLDFTTEKTVSHQDQISDPATFQKDQQPSVLNLSEPAQTETKQASSTDALHFDGLSFETTTFDSNSSNQPAIHTPDANQITQKDTDTQAQLQPTDTLNFDFQTPTTDAVVPEAPAFDLNFQFDLQQDHQPQHEVVIEPQPQTAQPEILQPEPLKFETFNLDPIATEAFVAPVSLDIAPATMDAPQASGFADANDPIIQAFPNLAEQDPIDLDLELAEQYIQLGEFVAAKQLIEEQYDHFSYAQSHKAEQLLQKIA